LLFSTYSLEFTSSSIFLSWEEICGAELARRIRALAWGFAMTKDSVFKNLGFAFLILNLISVAGCGGGGNGPIFVPRATTAAHGALFVADQGNRRILAYLSPFNNGMDASLAIGATNTSSPGEEVVSASTVRYPGQAVFDNGGNLWVPDTENNRVLRFSTPFSTGMNADLVLGQASFTTARSALTQSGLAGPTALVFDGSGDVFISDADNQRVLEFHPPFSNGMKASIVIGQADFTTETGAIIQGAFDTPRQLAIDPSGNFWVADNGFNRVLEFKPPFTSGMDASVVLGQPDFVHISPTGGQNGLSGPLGVASDKLGNIFVADGNSHRVLEFQPPFSNGMKASIVIGQADFTSISGGASPTQFVLPSGLAFDPDGNLWVFDFSGNRVLEFQPPFSTGMAASLVIGQSDFTSVAEGRRANGLNGPIGGAIKP
jgi:sugar lactone lactonase YvrE